MVVDSFPAENSKTETELLIESGGGPAANAAWLLARWGVPTALAALVGDDEYGEKVIAELRGAGVDCRLMRQHPNHLTPVSFIVANRSVASRTIINRKQPQAHLRLELGAFELIMPKLVLCDGHELEASVAALDAFPSAITVLDAGSLRAGTQALAKRVRYLVCSERFAVQVTGCGDLSSGWKSALPELRHSNEQTVVVTLGERGLFYLDGHEFGHVPALAGPACDTTAAGDIFHGAFAFALLQAMPLRDALELATVAAGLSVRKFGGRPSAPDLMTVQNWGPHGT